VCVCVCVCVCVLGWVVCMCKSGVQGWVLMLGFRAEGGGLIEEDQARTHS